MNDKEYEIREELHKQICDDMHDLYVRKNRDYGSSVTDTYKKFGITSFLVRIADKFNRVTNLVGKDENLVKDEKIEDTLMDLANYAILALIELKMDKPNIGPEKYSNVVNDLQIPNAVKGSFIKK